MKLLTIVGKMIIKWNWKERKYIDAETYIYARKIKDIITIK